MRSKYSSGFTLIEVLIAATILFAVIAVVSQSYRGATIASEKASRTIEMASLTPLLLETIRFHISQADVTKPITQQGVLNGYEFSWTAVVIQAGAPPDKISPESDSVITFTDRFYIWQVELSLSKNEYSRQFGYKELSWKTQ